MVVEGVDLTADAMVPAAAALDLFPEVRPYAEVAPVDVHDTAACAVDLPHGTPAHGEEIQGAGMVPLGQIDLERHRSHFVQISCENTSFPILFPHCLDSIEGYAYLAYKGSLNTENNIKTDKN